MSLTCAGVLFLTWVWTGAALDLASPEVFNANFYVNTNKHVLPRGTVGASAARTHWLQHGIDMGLQAAGDFHSAQYLARYPDLVNAYGAHNYRQAVTHYLTNGLTEKRLGYLEGGYGGRWTVSDDKHRLFVSASRRMGAAIDSLVWDHHEFINAWDHGRELQMAMNFVPNGECYNPTEAGGRDDSQHNTTHTQIQHVTASGNTLTTQVLPAFWLQAGHTITIASGTHCQVGMPALNTQNTYPHPFSKTVTLNCPSVDQPCLHFRSTFTIAGNVPNYTTLQMEAPTGYLTGEFTKIQSLDPVTGHFVSYTNRNPVVFSTTDERYAMGVFAPDNQDTDLHMYYGSAKFPSHTAPAATNKWNVVFRKNTINDGTTRVLHYDVYICVGRISDVTACLLSLAREGGPLVG